MRAVEHAPVWEWRAWWWIPDERDVPQIPSEIDERRTEHVCLDSDRVGAVLHRAVARPTSLITARATLWEISVCADEDRQRRVQRWRRARCSADPGDAAIEACVGDLLNGAGDEPLRRSVVSALRSEGSVRVGLCSRTRRDDGSPSKSPSRARTFVAACDTSCVTERAVHRVTIGATPVAGAWVSFAATGSAVDSIVRAVLREFGLSEKTHACEFMGRVHVALQQRSTTVVIGGVPTWLQKLPSIHADAFSDGGGAPARPPLTTVDWAELALRAMRSGGSTGADVLRAALDAPNADASARVRGAPAPLSLAPHDFELRLGTLVLARICGGSGPLYHHGLGRNSAPVEGDTLLHLAYRLRAAEPVLDVLRAARVGGDLRNAEGDRASDVALQMKVRLQAEQIEQLRDQVRRLGAAPVA